MGNIKFKYNMCDATTEDCVSEAPTYPFPHLPSTRLLDSHSSTSTHFRSTLLCPQTMLMSMMIRTILKMTTTMIRTRMSILAPSKEVGVSSMTRPGILSLWGTDLHSLDLSSFGCFPWLGLKPENGSCSTLNTTPLTLCGSHTLEVSPCS